MHVFFSSVFFGINSFFKGIKDFIMCIQKRLLRIFVLFISLGFYCFTVSIVWGANQEISFSGPTLAALESWSIVIPETAIPSELYAAEEFQHFFKKSSGTNLPIISSTTSHPSNSEETQSTHHLIFIGSGKAMQQSSAGFNTDRFGPEDFRIIIQNNTIAIAGGKPRGTLYGVYTFLETWLGVRFLTENHTHVPPLDRKKSIGPEDRFYHPSLTMRTSSYAETRRDPVFAARMRVNTVPGPKKLGGTTPVRTINHSFYRQIPSTVYGKAHPEYYALVKGKRLSQVKSDAYDTQPCLTNPEVLDIVTRDVLNEIKKHPGRNYIAISQNDSRQYCRCSKCAAIDQREGTPMGSLLTFVNAVADRVAKEHPQIMVGTLSYLYSRKPPRTIKPRPNVQIQLCSIECCQIHAINDPDCPKNVEFCNDLKAWSRLTDHISIWNYNVNFKNYLLPCPNLRVLEPNIRFFADNRVTGVYMQAAGNAISTELSDLRNYMICRLLWNPSQSGEALMDEFVTLHYKKAAGSILKFIDLIHDTAEASGRHRHCMAHYAQYYGIHGWDVASRGLALFDKALALEPDGVVHQRVEKASIAALRLAIEPIWYVKDPKKMHPCLLKEMQPLIKRFLDLCERYGVERSRETAPFAKDQTRLEGLID
jgi:Domain of unknown function (DUF4838)